MEKCCAIIGSGLGGLAAAAGIAHQGIRVDIFEQNKTIGGKSQSLNVDGFRFDTGPSILTMPFVLESLFDDLEVDPVSLPVIKPLRILCKYFYPDGTIINAYGNTEAFAEEIENKARDTGADLMSYLKYCEGIYDFSADIFLFNSFHEYATLRRYGTPYMLFHLMRIDPFRSVHRANRSFFKDPRLIQLFDRYATYNGSDPYQAPATLNIIPHVENTLGGFLVQGGIHQIPRALTRLCRDKGVSIHTGTEVQSIVMENKRVKGIEINDSPHPYDMVVSNADVHYTYKHLIRDRQSRWAKRYARLEPSASAVVFYWGVQGRFDDLEIHNILFSEDYRKEFKTIFSDRRCPEDPTVYIYISAKYHSSDAPEGCENWFVLVNAPYNSGQEWEEEINQCREAVFRKVETILGVDLRSRLLCEKVLHPLRIENDTSSRKGSIYGISSNSRVAAFMRQRNRSTYYKGLYFCGGSAHPGGGIPLVLLSGKITADLIRRHE